MKYTALERELRVIFRDVRAMLRDANMHQTERPSQPEGCHIAEIAEFGPNHWGIEIWTTVRYDNGPTQEELVNTVVDIVNDASDSMLKTVVTSSTSVEVFPNDDEIWIIREQLDSLKKTDN